MPEDARRMQVEVLSRARVTEAMAAKGKLEQEGEEIPEQTAEQWAMHFT